MCIGLNYRGSKTGAAIPPRRAAFLKDPASAVAPCDRVLIPWGSAKAGREHELAVPVGRRAGHPASPEEGLRHIAGFGG